MRRRSPGSRLPLTLHWPGESWLHRLPVGLKFLGLVALSALVVALNHPWLSVGVFAAAAIGILSARVPWRVAVRQALPFVLMIAFVVALQIVIGRTREGILVGARLLAVALLALALTLTTTPGEVVAAIERGLRRLRVHPDRVFRVGLVVGIALRSLDHLGEVAAQVLEARRARGLQRSLRAFAVPTVVAAGRFAHGVGEALVARGIAPPDRGDGSG